MVVKIIVPFWIPIIIRHLIFRERDHLILTTTQVENRADGVVAQLFANPDELPCAGWLFFVLGYIHDIAAMAVTTGLIHPDAHGGTLLYFKSGATGDVTFSWYDFGASSLHYINGTGIPSSGRWRHQIKTTLSYGIKAANNVCGGLAPADWANLADDIMGADHVSDASMLSALATAFEVSFLRASPSMAHILSRVSRMSAPWLLQISSLKSDISSLKSDISSLKSDISSGISSLQSQMQTMMRHLNLTEKANLSLRARCIGCPLETSCLVSQGCGV